MGHGSRLFTIISVIWELVNFSREIIVNVCPVFVFIFCMDGTVKSDLMTFMSCGHLLYTTQNLPTSYFSEIQFELK